MFTVDTLLKNILDSGFFLSESALNELQLSETIPSMFKVLITNLKIDDQSVSYINDTLIMSISSINKKCNNCASFIMEGTNVLWSYILEHFDDSQLYSLIISIYLCISNNNIRVEYILKVYGILFSNQRSLDMIVEMETFYDEKANDYVNNYNTFLGLIMNRISVSETNYESRVVKLTDLILKVMKNGETKAIIISWFSNLINSSKHFKNNYVFQEDYNRKVIHPKYFRLVMNILLVMWKNCKKKNKCKLENLDMEYYKNLSAVVNLDDKKYDTKIENKFMNDVFFMIVGIIEIFYNNLNFMIDQYKQVIYDLKGQLRQVQLTGLSEELKDRYLDKITKCHLEMIDIEYCNNDKLMNSELKKFQKDLADIINLKLKSNSVFLDMILETNINLINGLRIFEDSLFNYNFTNFENGIILSNYKTLRNPFLRHKYVFFSTYYITDNSSRNICDLRFKTIENVLVPNLIQFYIDMEDIQDESFYEKPVARWNIINFLNFIVFKEPYIYGSQIERYGKNLDTKFIRFVNLYINDLSGFFDETFDLIRKINEIEKDNIFISFNEQEDSYLHLDKHLDLYKKYKSLKINLDFLRSMFNFMVVLSKDSQGILLSSELGEKYCSQINYYLNEITSKNKRKLYNIKNKYDVGFQPLNLLDFLIKIILSCLNNPLFINFMAKDTRSYKPENIKFAVDKLWRNHLLTQNEYDKLLDMSTKIDRKMKEEEEIEVPDEFCDPLMACEIMEPVMLPDTDIIMEKSVIARHLLTDLHNPFNREPLTIEKLDKFNKKSRIKYLLKIFIEKKEEWKRGCS